MSSKAKHAPPAAKRCDFIAVSDFHLCDSSPVCRTDDVFETSLKKLRFIVDYSKELGCPILDAGDLFHKWKVSNRFLNEVIEILKDVSYVTVPGNHDLKYHNLSNIKDTSLGILKAAGSVQFEESPENYISLEIGGSRYIRVHCFPWGCDLDYEAEYKDHFINIALMHRPISLKKVAHVKTNSAKKIQSRMAAQGFPIVISGDYHIPLTLRGSSATGELLVNGGGVMRLNADEIDKKPVFYKVCVETMTATPVEFPIEDCISRTHISRREDLENGNLDYIEIISSQKSNNKTLDFEKELEEVMYEHDATEEVKTEVYRLTDTE
jgi:hypothetical protein